MEALNAPTEPPSPRRDEISPPDTVSAPAVGSDGGSEGEGSDGGSSSPSSPRRLHAPSPVRPGDGRAAPHARRSSSTSALLSLLRPPPRPQSPHLHSTLVSPALLLGADFVEHANVQWSSVPAERSRQVFETLFLHDPHSGAGHRREPRPHTAGDAFASFVLSEGMAHVLMTFLLRPDEAPAPRPPLTERAAGDALATKLSYHLMRHLSVAEPPFGQLLRRRTMEIAADLFRALEPNSAANLHHFAKILESATHKHTHTQTQTPTGPRSYARDSVIARGAQRYAAVHRGAASVALAAPDGARAGHRRVRRQVVRV